MAPAHLQKIEAGLVNVTLLSLVRIVEGLDATMANLFPAAEPPAQKRRDPPAE